MKASEHRAVAKQILAEIGRVLERVDPKETGRLIDELLAAEKVFLFAVGRVFLSLECFGKRLGHLGIDCQVVGSIAEKPITPRDLLLVASGSGESRLPVEIARLARAQGGKVGLLTSAAESTLHSLCDFAVHLPCPTKRDKAAGVPSVQPMSTLFDQSLHLYGDVVALLLQRRKGWTQEEMRQHHANLE